MTSVTKYNLYKNNVVVMEPTAEILFNYLRDVIYNPTNAVLDVEKLPGDFREFGRGLQYLADCVFETKSLARAVSKGDLSGALPSRGNEIAAPLKSMHASLRHLIWQAQRIARGDYSQRVNFMGEFSDAFNSMVEQLADRQRKLEDKINQIQMKTASLEQSNLLLTNLIKYAPQQIFVLDSETREILLMNEIAKSEINNDVNYLENLTRIISGSSDLEDERGIPVTYPRGKKERHLEVKKYYTEWKNANAVVFVVNDVSATKNKIEELEGQVYNDSLTGLFNRTFGMLTLDNWLREKKRFTLIFADLDKLKYINDQFGHQEGDLYIKNAAKHLQTFSSDVVACRVGGDEYMLLAPDLNYEEAYFKMSRVYKNFQNDTYLNDKPFSYSISFGIVCVDKDNDLPASDILSAADDRMYLNKRIRKKARIN